MNITKKQITALLLILVLFITAFTVEWEGFAPRLKFGKVVLIDTLDGDVLIGNSKALHAYEIIFAEGLSINEAENILILGTKENELFRLKFTSNKVIEMDTSGILLKQDNNNYLKISSNSWGGSLFRQVGAYPMDFTINGTNLFSLDTTNHVNIASESYMTFNNTPGDFTTNQPDSAMQVRMYMKNNRLYFRYYDGADHYFYLDLTATTEQTLKYSATESE